MRHIILPSKLYHMDVDHEDEIEYPMNSDDVEFCAIGRGMDYLGFAAP